MDIIKISKINKCFGTGANMIYALKDVDLTILKGDFVAIMGQSGSGKSTLMNILGCLDTPTSGSYLINGAETKTMNSNELADLRSKTFGFIFQRYNLLPHLTTIENVALPAIYRGIDATVRIERAKKLLTELELGAKFLNKPNELSGGQQQRVSIARALMNGGEIILADEPIGALDSKSGEMVMELIQDLHRKGHTVILVTHDKNIANYANRIIELKDGVIISDVRRDEISENKNTSYCCTKKSKFSHIKDMAIESFKMSIQAIISHRMRSLFTMLGIIIGIASVVSVVSLGLGSQQKIMDNIKSMGTNTIDIIPGKGFADRFSGRVKTLTIEDSKVLSMQPYLASSTPNVSANGTLVYGSTNAKAQLNGVSEQYFDVKAMNVVSGRLLTKSDIDSNASVVVIDDNTKNSLFKDVINPIGEILIFDRRPLEIVGVLEKQNKPGPNSQSLGLYAPYTTVMYKITGAKHISSITVKVLDTVSSQMAENNITSLLMKRHKGVQDFFMINSDSIKQTIESTTTTMTILISSIAFISLLVGGIGVMNIMLVSVTERTKEIGLRMAIGARQSNIMLQFLLEAILICFIGGLFGIILSILISLVFNFLTREGGAIVMSFSIIPLFLAIAFSSIIGIIFGFFPAKNASKLNPIEALARE